MRRLRLRETGVVHQRGQAAEGGTRGLHRGDHLGSVADVGGDGQHSAIERPSRLPQRIPVLIDQDDLPGMLGEEPAAGETDATRPPGDQDRPGCR